MSDDVARLVESAQRLGIELDAADTERWLAAMTREDGVETADIVIDEQDGVFGHRVSMLDFSARDLARFRRIGEVVEVTGPEGVAESALALSGSAAQSKIQTHPGDADFFQRLNIKAGSRDEACAILAGLMRDKAIGWESGPTYQFIEAKWSSFPFDCVRDGEPQKQGAPISWRLDEIKAGAMTVEVDGAARSLSWDELATEPGWCKLDWVVVDAEHQRLTNASNVIDVTWEAPDGAIVPLDGYLDAYFQEVYLDAGQLPTFTKVVQHVSGNALDEYIDQLEGEVRKYLDAGHANYGKAAKRMYNVFRLTGRHLDAAYVRELFDEPTTMLYQVWSLIGTLENAAAPGSTIPVETVRAQTDELVLTVVRALDGVQETELVAALLKLRTALEEVADGGEVAAEGAADIESAKTQVVNLINNFFRDRLTAVPTIKDYMDSVTTAADN
ncbi:MAG TPA: hypothetical protein PLZ93_13570 [Nocardioides sp.]|uniref:hypothetical protein n=1 Tax=uncultured Nocardioides sp. TaxID=198441 RepID=UPI000EED8A84|nr:hypothetical protein [uncultured Nocardioides sp.]HCB07703.1 hypothetical protein [Nocardioides sp.]HRD61777.1 hypothetical protein [Nocardioides sp.]HRI96638.1 hypothetical protein [Nocardioides sp.]HRK46483.1 hypothetical protein [Nocardioides sp.]